MAQQPARNYHLPATEPVPRRDLPVSEADWQKLLGTNVSVPLRALLGMMPPDYWWAQAAQGRACLDAIAGEPSVGTLQAQTTEIPENEFVAFRIARQSTSGRLKGGVSKWVHYANVDSGS